jgi:hypothetical protein
MPLDLELEQAVEKLQKSDARLSKADQYQQLRKFSNRARLPTETPEKAFVKFITADPLGKQLYARFVQTKAIDFNVLPSGVNPGAGGDPKRQTGSDADGDESSRSLQTLHEIAVKIRARHPQLSPQQATAKALQTPEGARAALQERQDRLAKAQRILS